MNFSIIVPIARKDKKYLKRCLLSIIDQDHESWEVIVVGDGFKPESISDKRIKYYKSDKSGASQVRNLGASKASGKYLFFFDADCTLYPGMLQKFFDIFKKSRPDFIYGAYRFNTDTSNVYPSIPFDPYLLESMNYISTMSPMKREVFDEIDGFRDIEYFQDWDFWLRATKVGYYGHYLRDPIFLTETPDEKSISGNNHHTFRDKVLKIEHLNGIPSRDICVTTIAAPVQSIERAKVLNARYLGAHMNSSMVQSPRQFDLGFGATLLMGFFPEAIDSHMDMFPDEGIKAICWIGTDVWQLRNKFSWEVIQRIKKHYLSEIDIQFSNSPELQAELRELGIETEVLYQPLTSFVRATKLPKKMKVSAYFNEGHPLHNKFYLQDIAKSMPDVEFLFYGSGFKEVKDGNITYVGWRPIQQIVDDCRVHLRLTGHDGFPHTPIYHLMAGRNVLCNFPLPFAEYVDLIPNQHQWEDQKVLIIEKLRDLLTNDLLDVNKVRTHYLNLTSTEKYRKTIYERIQDAKKAKSVSSAADLSECSFSA